jgi:N-acyl homoserine lactone hydrolase
MRLYLLRLGVMRKLDAPVPGYLVRADDGTNVLIDTGYPADAPADGPVHVAEGQHVLAQLAGLGLRPGDIDYVVCSHLDPDHAGNHDLFPDAEFVVQRSHYELAQAGSVPRLGAASAHWDQPHLKYRMIDGDAELLPGIDLIESSGHVRGHQSVLVRLPKTGPVLLAIDAIPMAAALDPDQRPVFPFDLDADDLRRNTRKLVDLARRENAMIVHGHDGPQWSSLKVAPAYYD